MAAVIFDKKRIFSIECNSSQRGVKSITRKYIRYPTSIHAEVAAIIRAKTDLKRTSILVIRVNKSGKLTMAKPCQHCLAYLDFVGIKNCYFSNKNGEIERLQRKGD